MVENKEEGSVGMGRVRRAFDCASGDDSMIFLTGKKDGGLEGLGGWRMSEGHEREKREGRRGRCSVLVYL